jgi:hypothetical protein
MFAREKNKILRGERSPKTSFSSKENLVNDTVV